jgi:alpha-amylase
MDYETFGEHQWADTGIFEFLRYLPKELENYNHIEYSTPSEILELCKPKDTVDVFEFSTLSWADSERDLSAWLGNRMQQLSFQRLKEIRKYLGNYLKRYDEKERKELIEYKIYKNMQTSDNFYYMCTKGFNDMDVHSYFSHFSTPYDAYSAYLDAYYDFKNHLVLKLISTYFK